MRFASTTPRSPRRVISGLALAVVMLSYSTAHAQSQPKPAGAMADTGTSTDFYIMLGSDFDRPGLLPKANYNIGIGHTFGFLKKDPIGDELTFAYTYENAGTHGFLHTQYGEHTEQAGVMKNFAIPRTQVVSGYTWVQMGITTYTGFSHLMNHLDTG